MLFSKSAPSDKLFHLFQPTNTFCFPSADLKVMEEVKLDLRGFKVDKEGCETFQPRSCYKKHMKNISLSFRLQRQVGVRPSL